MILIKQKKYNTAQAGCSEIFIVGKLPTEEGKEILLFSIQETVKPETEADNDHSSNNHSMKHDFKMINETDKNHKNINKSMNNNSNNANNNKNNYNNNKNNYNNNNNDTDNSTWLLQVSWSPSRRQC